MNAVRLRVLSGKPGISPHVFEDLGGGKANKGKKLVPSVN
jgi:hypothetical protein